MKNFSNMARKSISSVMTLAYVFCGTLVTLSKHAEALPWDIDMYSQQSLQYTEIARNPVKGTVPLGYTPFTMTIEEAETKLTNPMPFEEYSVWRGKRLWNMQCSSCHGAAADSATKVGGLVGAPNLLEDRFKTYSDGRVYGTIVWGIRSMPRYGYKLSEGERWDIVNYLKFLQGKEVSGGAISRPVSSKPVSVNIVKQ